ncbi:hypothetical protein EYF80_063499 [Liparis tanakae]|uniref:Uncharacterized protein n=1 Tax=Liparis tanakae TaxID=230148 RepID=A0A4Z2ECY5_9TELE|nr:hypothetical protein EYF80_063499 [Liparis tanakae]
MLIPGGQVPLPVPRGQHGVSVLLKDTSVGRVGVCRGSRDSSRHTARKKMTRAHDDAYKDADGFSKYGTFVEVVANKEHARTVTRASANR